MKLSILLFTLGCCGLVPDASAQAMLPKGNGDLVVHRMCTPCHPIDVVVSNRQTKERWRSTVQDMVARGAQGSPADIDTVVNYLSEHFGREGGSGFGNRTAAHYTASTDFETSPRTPVQIPASEQWTTYGHDPGAERYSPLKQITPANVSELQRAWTFHSGKPGSECIPLVIDDVMYLTAPDAIYALEPETGKIIWKFTSSAVARRGLAYWPGDKNSHPRVYAGVENGKMVGLDATTGKPAPGFGNEGFIDLKKGVLGDLTDSRFSLASAPAVYKDVVITGGNNTEGSPSFGAYGDVRGWDARNGNLVWTFHTVPRPGEPGSETWTRPDSWKNRSGTNVWGLMTVDVKRGMVFLPLGCPTSDFYGADRPGNGLYGNALVALDAATGKVKWFQQLVHHDLWDYDLAAPPALIDIHRDGKTIPAVAQIGKTGILFFFNRLNGAPIYGMEERPVPQSTVPGEASSPTQPFPIKPPPLARLSMTKDDLSNVTPEVAAYCQDLWTKNHLFNDGPFTPMPVEGKGNAVNFPSTVGGGNWGGVSYDPALGYVFANVMDLAQWGHMSPITDRQTGQPSYMKTTPMGYGGSHARFWDPDGHIPCQKPPFGELVAVNANTGDIAWKVPLGINEELAAKGIKNTGELNVGGSIATASGLVFIAATYDARFRAFDARTGKELWTEKIDAPGDTIPITYLGRDGKQYVVVNAGGGSAGTSDSLVAFALPATHLAP